jgi:hypothetical protein
MHDDQRTKNLLQCRLLSLWINGKLKLVNAADNSSSEHRRNLQDIKLCPHLSYPFCFNFLLLHVNLENSIHFGTEHFEAFKT